jgi:dienelactone hydrolase
MLNSVKCRDKYIKYIACFTWHEELNLKRQLVALILLALAHTAYALELGEEAYGILQMAFSYDESYPLNARIAGTVKSDGISFEKVVFDSFHDGAVPGLLSIPETGEDAYPVVLLMHGLTGTKENWLKHPFSHGGQITRGLLEEGYAVMALDAQYHGDRAVNNDYINPGEMVFQRGWGVRYSNMMTQTIVDYRRAIDYLATRNEIDTSRVGIVGFSMGGHMTFILNAVEPRVKAVVACVVPETPGMPIAASTFTRSMGRTPFLMMMGRKDRFYTVQQAQTLFDRVPGENKTLQFFDSGHSLPPEYTGQVVKWIAKKL